ncbi:MAG: glycosyltransferase family 1 protein [bacterium]
MTNLVIDGWYLQAGGFGLAEFAARCVDLILSRNETMPVRIQVAMPGWYRETGRVFRHIPHAVFLRSIHSGHDLIDRIAWQNRLGLWCKEREDCSILFSPAQFWSLAAPRRTVVVYHDCIYRHFPESLGTFMIRKWSTFRAERFLHTCTAVITESEFSRKDIAHYAGIRPDRVVVIPAWLPTQYSRDNAAAAAAEVRSRYALPDRFWLYVGGYDRRKNVEFLLEAYATAMMKSKCPSLVLAGSLPGVPSPLYCDVLGTLHKLNLAPPQICLPGFIAAQDMPGLFGAAELLVYPSLCEGYGLPPFEAMGCGCPAVVADNSSLVEVVRDRDYRFTTDKPAGLSAILQRAACRPLPLNPSFTPGEHSDTVAADAYSSLITRICAQ